MTALATVARGRFGLRGKHRFIQAELGRIAAELGAEQAWR